MTEMSNEPGHTHRYPGTPGSPPPTDRPASHAPTATAGAPPPPYGPGGPPTGTPPPPTRRRGAGVVIVAAVLAGALAGTGGAVAYGAATDDDAASQPANAVSSLDSAPDGTSADQTAADGSAEAVANQMLPSVVQINVATPRGASNGTGIVISSDGQILTNNHVVEAAAEGGSLTVLFNNGDTAEASILGRDPLTDVAVIQAEDVSGLKTATLGSSEQLDVGEEVIAIGAPYGLESTVTTGIVSALNRPVSAGGTETASTVFPAIQTDAAINPGNSGGPLVNTDGQVIGINSAIQTDPNSMGQTGSIGLGFAIPIDLARSIANQIVEGEQPTHARIGIKITDAVQSDQITTVGAKVAEVTEGSGGDQAGLQSGDIITSVNGSRVTSANGLIALIRSYRPGDEVTIGYQRDGEQHKTKVTLGSDQGSLGS